MKRKIKFLQFLSLHLSQSELNLIRCNAAGDHIIFREIGDSDMMTYNHLNQNLVENQQIQVSAV